MRCRPQQVPVFRPDGAYIITGGLGGLGLFLAEKMAAAGCGRIVLNARSQPSAEAQETIELHPSDRRRHRGGVRRHRRRRRPRERLVDVATATGLPVRGVLHAAAVVEDATLTNITDELIDRDWAPKVYGAWNLHEATPDQPLDWFCSFSSAAALVGSPGQGAYAAANSWLDGFTHWRRAQGLPATAIAWGAWAEVGRATALAEDTGAGDRTRRGRPRVRALLRYDRAYTGYAPIMGTPWLTAFAQRSRSPRRSSPWAKASPGTGKFRAELEALPREEWPSTIPAAGLRTDQPDPAPDDRSRPATVRIRARLAGQPGAAHPDRNRDGYSDQPTRHHHGPRPGRSPVRAAGARRSRRRP